MALEVVRLVRNQFEHGVFVVELATVTDHELVAATIAQTLQLKEVKGQSFQQILIEYLRDKKLLLVLDNFEQVVTAAPLVSELTGETSQLKVLVTSRVLLHNYGEQEFALAPLALPDLKSTKPNFRWLYLSKIRR